MCQLPPSLRRDHSGDGHGDWYGWHDSVPGRESYAGWPLCDASRLVRLTRSRCRMGCRRRDLRRWLVLSIFVFGGRAVLLLLAWGDGCYCGAHLC